MTQLPISRSRALSLARLATGTARRDVSARRPLGPQRPGDTPDYSKGGDERKRMPSRSAPLKDSMPSPGVRRRPGGPGWQLAPAGRRRQSASAFNDRRHRVVAHRVHRRVTVRARERERRGESVETNEISDSLCCVGIAAGARRCVLFIYIVFFSREEFPYLGAPGQLYNAWRPFVVLA